MHHRMPLSKTAWPSLKVEIFPPVMRLVLPDPKTVTTSDFIYQIHELTSEDHRILAKSIAGQLDISCERVRSIIHEDLDMQKLSAKWVPKCRNTDQKCQRCQSEQILEYFGAFQTISCHDCCSWTKPGYIALTQRQSNNQKSGCIAAHPVPKNSKCKNLLEKFLPRFFGIKKASPSLTILQRARLSMRSITHLCWCNWRAFWRKNAHVERSPRRSCSCMTMSQLTRHLQPRRNWPTWASNVLITHPILQIWPRRTTTCSPDGKNNWKVAIFRPMRRSLLPWRASEFFWVACKS